MDADLKKIKKLTEFMKKSGLITLKIKDIELNLSPKAHTIEPLSKEDDQKPEETVQQYTAEDIMLWSAPGNLES